MWARDGHSAEEPCHVPTVSPGPYLWGHLARVHGMLQELGAGLEELPGRQVVGTTGTEWHQQGRCGAGDRMLGDREMGSTWGRRQDTGGHRHGEHTGQGTHGARDRTWDAATQRRGEHMGQRDRMPWDRAQGRHVEGDKDTGGPLGMWAEGWCGPMAPHSLEQDGDPLQCGCHAVHLLLVQGRGLGRARGWEHPTWGWGRSAWGWGPTPGWRHPAPCGPLLASHPSTSPTGSSLPMPRPGPARATAVPTGPSPSPVPAPSWLWVPVPSPVLESESLPWGGLSSIPGSRSMS